MLERMTGHATKTFPQPIKIPCNCPKSLATLKIHYTLALRENQVRTLECEWIDVCVNGAIAYCVAARYI